MAPSSAAFVYRGQLDVEFSRIQFLLGAVAEAFDAVDSVLLSPGRGSTETEWCEFSRQFASVRSSHVIDASRGSLLGARRTLARLLAHESTFVVAVGFSSAAHLPRSGCAVWAVNGIPEERLLHHDGTASRLAVRFAWRAARRTRHARAVVVSGPMGRVIHDRLGNTPLVIPNAVDRSVFTCHRHRQPAYLTYVGGGSPWQGLDKLGAIWQALHALEPSLQFRVITRDDRAKALAQGIDPASIEVVSTDDPHRVAALLAEARLGFLVREPHLVNEVAFPMKLGEYLAAGAPVVVSRSGWDAERLIERHQAGVLVDWVEPSVAIAHRIAAYLRGIGPGRPSGVDAAARALDAARWRRTLVDELRSVASASTVQKRSS